MLQVVNQTPTRMILRDQRPTAGLVSIIFVFLSISAVSLLIFQGVSIFSDRIIGNDGLFWFIGMAIFIALGFGFTLLGITAALNFLVGTTFIMDRETEEFVIERVGFLRTRAERHSLYGIKRIEVEENAEVHAFGVFVVLRNGESLPVASFHDQDEDAMRAVVREIHAFLQNVGYRG
jgi:hypothetical protein